MILLAFYTGVPAAADLPNVVIIFTDDQGYADVGCFGAKEFATPNLDRMAREGRRFTNFHVAQPVCTASRTALLTGCYPNRVGLHGALPPGRAWACIRSGNWKLVLPHTYRTLDGNPGGRDGKPVKYQQAKVTQPELYDLTEPALERNDVASRNPEIVEHLQRLTEKAREDLGDALTGRQGNGVREPGRTTDSRAAP